MDTTTMNSTTNDSRHEPDSICSDMETGVGIYKLYLVSGVLPVCIVGLALNAVSVLVWSAEHKGSCTMLLFQSLGVVDNLLLKQMVVESVLFYVDQLTARLYTAIRIMQCLSQGLSVRCSLMAGGFLWLTVVRPHWARKLTRRHVLMTCGGVGAWCGLLTFMGILTELTIDRSEAEYMVITLVQDGVMVILPTLTLMGLSLSLLRVSWREKRRQTARQHGGPMMVVHCLAFSSFLSCLPDRTTSALLDVLVKTPAGGGRCAYRLVVRATIILIRALNSSVNFFIYFFFTSEFRPLLRQTWQCCLDRFRQCPHRFLVMCNTLQARPDSGNGTDSRGGHHRRQLDDCAGEPGEDLTEEQGNADKCPAEPKDDLTEQPGNPEDWTEELAQRQNCTMAQITVHIT